MKVSNKVLDAVLALLREQASQDQKALVEKWAKEGKAKRDELAQTSKALDQEKTS